MMLYLGPETQTLKDGLVNGETSLLEQGATQGPPILVPTLDRPLLAVILDRPLLVATLDRPLLAAILDRHLQEPILDRPLLAAILHRHLQEPTLAQQLLLILDHLHQEATLGNRVGLGPTRLLDSQVLLEPSPLLAPLASLLDH
ncbi:unnamed protein product [Gulo gulo]|uniref:Uncharacterized protein n=1 Tax=Gulo gulo TaxID=48420 RepID=A0A9X9LJ44_GULGU|nr:unnamed protein product [Gulo gulo]